MNPIKPIRTEAEHAAALARVEALMMIEPEVARDSPEGDELELLAILVADYEKQRWPIPDPWFEQIKALCAQLDVPFDPFDPELTIASLVAAYARSVRAEVTDE